MSLATPTSTVGGVLSWFSSRLPERSGISAEYRPSELRGDIEMAGVVALASVVGSQQKVSLFHNRQLRFSNLRPSSKEAAHFENTIAIVRMDHQIMIVETDQSTC